MFTTFQLQDFAIHCPNHQHISNDKLEVGSLMEYSHDDFPIEIIPDCCDYHLVNVYITIEHHHFQWENSLFRLGHFQ